MLTRYSPVGVTVSMSASSCGSPTPGKGCSRTELTQLNTVVFTAMPRPSVRTATAVNQGLRRRIRNPNHTSFKMVYIENNGSATRIPNRKSLATRDFDAPGCPLLGLGCPESRVFARGARTLRRNGRAKRREAGFR